MCGLVDVCIMTFCYMSFLTERWLEWKTKLCIYFQCEHSVSCGVSYDHIGDELMPKKKARAANNAQLYTRIHDVNMREMMIEEGGDEDWMLQRYIYVYYIERVL